MLQPRLKYTWNIQGKSLERLGHWLEYSQSCSVDVAFLQEVAGLHGIKQRDPNIEDVGLAEFEFGEDNELHDYRVLGSCGVESHLSQVILLDELVVDHLVPAKSGRRCVEVTFVHKILRCKWFVLGCHLPHSNDAEEVFQQALWELECACHRASDCPVAIVGGDFNCQCGDDRFLQLVALMSSKNFCIIYREVDTWYNFGTSRRYDFFFLRVQGAIKHLEPAAELAALVVQDAMKELPSDHSLVGVHLLLASRALGTRTSVSTSSRSGCRRARVDEDKLKLSLQQHLAAKISSSIYEQWSALQRCSWFSCIPRHSLKYVDSRELKELCALKRAAADPDERTRLARLILAKRASDKLLWWRGLEDMAGSGDSAAIQYLQGRARAKASHTNLVRASGGKFQAAKDIESHFVEVFAGASQQEVELCRSLAQRLREKVLAADTNAFQPREIREHIARYCHDRKTFGLSGVPNELLRAISHDDEGVHFLCDHLTQLLRDPLDVPEDIYQAFLCLIPKRLTVSLPKDFRPISLLESTLKLCSGMVFKRWLHGCEIPRAQKGALPGCQTVSCLMAAQHYLYLEYRTGMPAVWLLLDIQQAFDS